LQALQHIAYAFVNRHETEKKSGAAEEQLLEPFSSIFCPTVVAKAYKKNIMEGFVSKLSLFASDQCNRRIL